MSFESVIYIFGGAIIIGFGGILANISFNKMAGEAPKKKTGRAFKWYFQLPAILTTFFSAIVIGIGSLMLSFGWNRYEADQAKMDLINSVGHELAYNSYLLTGGLFDSTSEVFSNPGEWYSQLKCNASQDLINSSYLKYNEPIDDSLLQILAKFILRVDNINQRFEYTNIHCLNFKDKDSVLEYRLELVKSNRLKWYVNIHEELTKFIWEHYPVDVRDDEKAFKEQLAKNNG